ncbi:hypothetical protein COL26b_008489 [Colletotrichum chrysophilum]|uniref:uncharacterized protein n=1 Tax=Colletotrichum chrysophilum TaxID=1836956 RepID=UPI002301EB37|nr:uncharacterized protein COL26b_008489 [Colletotrichum chrysophilum]KAJ0337238.1 hypothetical protein KNSL1_012969 [Colletotrichum chrysophilum]KAJ0373362.1 hypothetical protein COL26b_008489 [Colletotrichum chrysophilum]
MAEERDMSLCSTCSSIDLLNIPTYPEKYMLNKGSIFRPTLSLLQLWGPWKEDEVSQFGVQFHRTFEDLLNASTDCAVCVAVLNGAYVFKSWLAQLSRQNNDGHISKYLKDGSVWEMQLVKYSEDTDNILVISFDAEQDAINLIGDVNLPTRVLDVGIQDDQTNIKLCEVRHAPGKYAALSYMWGQGKDHFRTTLASLEEHKSGIDMKVMPQTFQDAIVTTRRLGLRYLWIDALWLVLFIYKNPNVRKGVL